MGKLYTNSADLELVGFAILIHPGPIKPKTYAMQGMVGVEVAADGVGMERDKDDIEEL